MLSSIKMNYVLGAIVIFIVLIIISSKSNFYDTIDSTGNRSFTDRQPKSFSPVAVKPDIPEEIGLAMAYPQGVGVGMDSADSNSFAPSAPGPLLVNYVNPESYGESSYLSQTPSATRVIRLKSTGNQSQFKPVDLAEKETFINGNTPLDYADSFDIQSNLTLESAPGHEGKNCETTFPRVVKYKGQCITEGDIPYGTTVDGKVNPRLVSRWESYTGKYSTSDALSPADGVLYPSVGTLI
jgi:hypothetical protein